MDGARTLTMSAKELDRLEVLGRVVERRLTQWQAAEQLGLSLRQVERLCQALRRDGAAGLVSRKRGCASNRKLPAVSGRTSPATCDPGNAIAGRARRASACGRTARS